MSKNIGIAYSMARRRNKKASGGTVKSGDKEMNYADGGEVDKEPVVEKTPDQAGEGPVSQDEAKKFAQGMCPSCGYSKGGMVANSMEEGAAADKLPNEFDDLALRDGLEFKYTGKNSGDEDGDDIVKRAMKRKK